MAVQSVQRLAAQDPPRTAEDLARALASESGAGVATAAAAARTSKDKQLTAMLQKALRAWSKSRDAEGNRVRLHLLDALIAHHARLPAAELLPLLEDPLTNMPAFILLCREARQNQAELFAMFRELEPPGTGSPWEQQALQRVAIGNLLCEQKAPGFAAFLWQQASFDLAVTVRGETVFGYRVGFKLPAVTDVAFVIPAGFPPEPVYILCLPTSGTDGSRAGEEAADGLLANGNAPVSIARIDRGATSRCPAPGYRFSFALCSRDEPLGWLEAMAGRPAGTHLAKCHLDLTFTTPETFVRDVDAARSSLNKERADLRAALLAAGALTTDQTRVPDPSIRVIIDDGRNDKQVPLPAIAEAK